MSWFDKITGTVGDTVSDAWDTASEGGQAWVQDQVSQWAGGGEQAGRPETVNQDPSPLPYTGDQAAQQQAAAAMAATNDRLVNWVLIGLGGLTAYLLYTGSGR